MTKYITLLQALASAPGNVAQQLKDVDEVLARQSPVTADWSIADTLSHLIDVEDRYRARLRRMVQEERPVLPAIWPDEQFDYPQCNLEELIDRFQTTRLETLAFLKACSPQDWQRAAIHETFGETDFQFLVQNLVNHDTVHLNQLAEVRDKLGLVPVSDG